MLALLTKGLTNFKISNVHINNVNTDGVSLGLSDHDRLWVSIPCKPNYNQVQHYTTCRMLNEQNIAYLKGRLNS